MTQPEKNDPFAILVKQLADVSRQMDVEVEVLFRAFKERSDWGYVLKVHCLLETAVSHLVENSFPKEVMKTMRKLTLHGRVGKVRLVKDLGLISAVSCKFIELFSELRNALTHDIHTISFTFSKPGTKKLTQMTNAMWDYMKMNENEVFSRKKLRDYIKMSALRILLEIYNFHSIRRNQV